MKLLAILAALLAFGALRLPLERVLAADRVKAGLRDDAGVPLNLREQVSQASLVALLGGLRSMAAAIWDLWACSAWEQTNYAQVERDYLFCQRLQPRTFYYYDRGQWMMAYNAAHYYEMQNTERGALNALLRSAYTDKGMVMLRTGQRFLPQEPRLYEQEATLYRDKVRPRQPLKEAAAWERAATSPGGPPYARRFQAYALAHAPGHEAEAEAMARSALLAFTRSESASAELLESWRAAYTEPLVRRSLQTWSSRLNRALPSTLLNLLITAELSREVRENPAADAQKLYTRLRLIHDRSDPNRTPLLYETLRLLESRLDLPLPDRVPEPREEPPVGTL
jgi:hypothetical protein